MNLRTRRAIAWILLSLLVAAGFGWAEELSEFGNPFLWVKVGQVRVKAEKVATPEKMYLGLGHRRELPEGRGMLFFMPEVAVQNFCMRGMRFPIDILWIVQGRVVGLEQQVPPEYPGSLVSPEPVNFVLEVPGGFAAKYGIKPGDPVAW